MAWAALTMGGGPDLQTTNEIAPSCDDESCEVTCDRSGKECSKECSSLGRNKKADCVDFCKRKQSTCAASCTPAETLE